MSLFTLLTSFRADIKEHLNRELEVINANRQKPIKSVDQISQPNPVANSMPPMPQSIQPVMPNMHANLSGPNQNVIPFIPEEEEKKEEIPDNSCPYCFREFTD